MPYEPPFPKSELVRLFPGYFHKYSLTRNHELLGGIELYNLKTDLITRQLCLEAIQKELWEVFGTF